MLPASQRSGSLLTRQPLSSASTPLLRQTRNRCQPSPSPSTRCRTRRWSACSKRTRSRWWASSSSSCRNARCRFRCASCNWALPLLLFLPALAFVDTRCKGRRYSVSVLAPRSLLWANASNQSEGAKYRPRDDDGRWRSLECHPLSTNLRGIGSWANFDASRPGGHIFIRPTGREHRLSLGGEGQLIKPYPRRLRLPPTAHWRGSSLEPQLD